MCEGAAGIGSVGDGIGRAHTLWHGLYTAMCAAATCSTTKSIWLSASVTASFVCALSPGVRELYALYELYLLLYDSFQFYCHPLEKTTKKKMAGHAKIRRILNNLPVFPKKTVPAKRRNSRYVFLLVQFSFGNTGRLFKIRRIFAWPAIFFFDVFSRG